MPFYVKFCVKSKKSTDFIDTIEKAWNHAQYTFNYPALIAQGVHRNYVKDKTQKNLKNTAYILCKCKYSISLMSSNSNTSISCKKTCKMLHSTTVIAFRISHHLPLLTAQSHDITDAAGATVECNNSQFKFHFPAWRNLMAYLK